MTIIFTAIFYLNTYLLVTFIVHIHFIVLYMYLFMMSAFYMWMYYYTPLFKVTHH